MSDNKSCITCKHYYIIEESTQCNSCKDYSNFLASQENIRNYNIGNSDYAKHKIQPWDIWLEYGLNPWDADIIKRILRKKTGDSRRLDYEKIIHICKERIRQLDINNPNIINNG